MLVHQFFLFVGNTNAQNKKIDSLKNELKNYNNKDSTRVKLLNALSYSFYKKNADTAKMYLSESELITNTINFEKGRAKSILIKGKSVFE